ncbi:DMT family transporter [Lacticaseibacillus zhaodongensis]|uniref:DMT family transporter n=1 Tax=Lacticaseibacillus zhaodongensis TaxID=2668065 RepID=UPI0018AF964A|nr:DMT family transporter [Lacticaseibacillus zhaodongensis]
MNKRWAFVMMTLVVAAWGASYMWMKVALVAVSPLLLVGLRFLIAFAVTMLVFPHGLHGLHKEHVQAALIMGTLLYGLFASVMFGLQHTSATTAGFLVATTAMFVMIFNAVLQRQLPRPSAIIATIAVIIGLFLLVANGHLQFSIGAPLCLLTAALYAVHIIYSGHVTRKIADTFSISVLQLGVAGVEGVISSLLFEKPELPATTTQWGAVLALGIICSAFGFVVQTKVQHFLTPETISLIFSLEPLFSAGFGIWLLGEHLSGLQMIGAALIFASVTINELISARRPASPCALN